jgi:hypothetical protein
MKPVSRFTALLCRTFCTLAAAVVPLFAPAPAAAQTNPNFEYGIDRPGSDYRSFDLQYDAPGLCAGQCAQEGQCRAWTYVKPGVQGPHPRCWLKSAVPAPIRNAYVISGLRGTSPQPPAPPPPVTPPVSPPTSAATFVGCFKDTPDFDLKGHLVRSAQNTPQRCVSTCQARGFAYAGVQYGESCLCGNSYGRYGAAANCNMPCTGDRGQACGGFNANSVYATGLTVVQPPSPPTVTPPVTPPVTPVSSGTLTGRWASIAAYAGGTYDFVQEGNSFSWTLVGQPERGQGTISGNNLQATWSGGNSGTGKVAQRSAAGDPIRLEWTNGVVMARNAPR